MAGHVARIIFFLIINLFLTKFVHSDGGRHSRFEYKLSFKGPRLTNKQGNVPFWTHYGSAIPSDDQIRITPSLKDQRGGLWAKTKTASKFWEAEVFFKVSGRGRVGGDGLAIWYTEESGKPGPVFGSSDNWKGMGLFMDSFDNDGEQNNPYVMAMVNDGSTKYDHYKDGNNQQLGGCMRDFRNKPHPVRVKIRYFNNILTVFYHGGMSNKDEDYELCMRSENVELAIGYFGITGGTGGLADDHDVMKFITHSLSSAEKEEERRKAISEEQRKKYEAQYGEYTQKLDAKKEQFQKEHPGNKPPDDKFESVYERDLRLVYEGQTNMQQLIRALHTKVGELTQEVNNLHTVVNTKQAQPPKQSEDGPSRQEINTMLSLQNQVHTAVKDLQSRSSDGDKGKLDQLDQSIQTILENVGHILTKTQGMDNKPPDCPVVNCVTVKNLIFVVVVLVCLFCGYQLYKKHLDQAAKKFY